MAIEELILKEEKKLTQLIIRHNEIVEYQNNNPSFYHDDEELSELLDSIEKKMSFIVKLKKEVNYNTDFS